MEKTKIALCFQDAEFQNRFLKCWIHHYDYEVHTFACMDELYLQKGYDVVLLEGVDIKELELEVLKNTRIFCLSENETERREGVTILSKYQEIYKIEQQIHRSLPPKVGNGQIKMVGVFSLDMELYQLPFCAMLAMELGEKESSILLNLQMASGLEEAETFAMEDLLISVATQSYSREQWNETILQEKNWDYISPMKNSQCFVEANAKDYAAMIEMLKKEFGYQSYIINYGQMFEGCMEWMNACDVFYLLVPNQEYQSRRERAFMQELKRHGVEQLQKRMVRIEIPNTLNPYEPWRELAEKWRWSTVGNQVRSQKQEVAWTNYVS